MDIVEIIGCYFIPRDLLKNCKQIVYKYVVYSRKTVQQNAFFECISPPTESKGNINRCLKIDAEDEACGKFDIFIWVCEGKFGLEFQGMYESSCTMLWFPDYFFFFLVCQFLEKLHT